MYMKTKDRIKSLNVSKQSVIKRFSALPNDKIGQEGDLGIGMIPKKGLHLFYKMGGQWYGVQLNKILKSDGGIPMYDRIKIGSVTDNALLGKSTDGLVIDIPSGTGSKTFKIERKANDGNPIIQMGSSDIECLQLVANYDSGGRGIDFAEIRTKTEGGGGDAGQIKVFVDDVQRLTIDDDGLDVVGAITATTNITATGDLAVNGGDTTIKKASGAATLLMQADNSAGAGDDWTISANADHTLSIGNDINSAGTPVTHLEITPNSTVIDSHISAKGDFSIPAGASPGNAGKLFLDGGGDTYIQEYVADLIQIFAGGDVLMSLYENGDDGNLVTFGGAAGWTRVEATFSDTTIIGSGGTDDTDIDFRFANKYRLEMTGDITTMNLIFPSSSGNFLLVCTTNGDHDVTNWKVWESDESAATTTDVMWAGGAVPAFTSSGVDIVSFYWDATEQQAYGTATLGFATP